MARYFVFNVPQHGHVNPTLAVVQALVASGHEVVYYLTDDFQQTIQSTGAQFRSYNSSLDQTMELVLDQSQRSVPGNVIESLFNECARVFPLALADAREARPDVILYTPVAIWGRLLSEMLAVPAISLRTSYASNERFQLFSLDSTRRDHETEVQETTLLSDFQIHFARLGAHYRLPPLDLPAVFSHTEALNLVFMPRVFQPAGSSFDKRFRFIGPCLSPRPDTTGFPHERWRKRQTLYISLGTIFNHRPEFYALCFQAFRRSPWQVVMSIGHTVAQDDLGTPPRNFLVHPSVPQLEILEQADVFITHGGMNSTMEALALGVPMVVIPQIKEQSITARRVTELGLGVALDRNNLTVDILHEAVAQVMSNPVYHMNTQKMKQTIEQAGGCKSAVKAITEFTKSRGLAGAR